MKLLAHQHDAASQLSPEKGGILADDMGLGKTCTAVEILKRANLNRILFAAPKEITKNLKEELAKWTKLPIFDLKTSSLPERLARIRSIGYVDKFIIIANLESWRNTQEIIMELAKLQLDAIVVDEAHHINNSETTAYRGIKELRFAVNQCPKCKESYTAEFMCFRKNCRARGKFTSLSHCFSCGFPLRKVAVPPCKQCGFDVRTDFENAMSVRFFLAMSGRIFINSASDIWTMLHLVDKERFPTKKQYVKEFCTTDQNGKHWFRPDGESRLLSILGPRFVRRSKKEAGIELPPQGIEVLEYDIDEKNYPEQYRVYRQIEKHYALRLDNQVVSIPEVIAQLTRLRQAIVWPAGIVIRDPDTKEVIAKCDVEESQKLDIVENLIRESTQENNRIIVFSHFRSPLRELKKRLGDTACVYDGATTERDRTRIRADFSAETREPVWQIALCNYRSAGEGLTFTGATETILVDEEWSQSKADQAYGRTNRIGQHRKTRVRIPRITETVDQWMADIIAAKATMNSNFETALEMIKEKLNGKESRT